MAQLYKKGDVCIIIPYLLYRAKGLLIETQQIIVLWFIGIQDDYNNLKVIKGGTQVELANAHRDLKVLFYMLFGHANLYRVILYHFPTAIKFITASALLKALFSKR